MFIVYNITAFHTNNFKGKTMDFESKHGIHLLGLRTFSSKTLTKMFGPLIASKVNVHAL